MEALINVESKFVREYSLPPQDKMPVTPDLTDITFKRMDGGQASLTMDESYKKIFEARTRYSRPNLINRNDPKDPNNPKKLPEPQEIQDSPEKTEFRLQISNLERDLLRAMQICEGHGVESHLDNLEKLEKLELLDKVELDVILNSNNILLEVDVEQELLDSTKPELYKSSGDRVQRVKSQMGLASCDKELEQRPETAPELGAECGSPKQKKVFEIPPKLTNSDVQVQESVSVSSMSSNESDLSRVSKKSVIFKKELIEPELGTLPVKPKNRVTKSALKKGSKIPRLIRSPQISPQPTPTPSTSTPLNTLNERVEKRPVTSAVTSVTPAVTPGVSGVTPQKKVILIPYPERQMKRIGARKKTYSPTTTTKQKIPFVKKFPSTHKVGNKSKGSKVSKATHESLESKTTQESQDSTRASELVAVASVANKDEEHPETLKEEEGATATTVLKTDDLPNSEIDTVPSSPSPSDHSSLSDPEVNEVTIIPEVNLDLGLVFVTPEVVMTPCRYHTAGCPSLLQHGTLETEHHHRSCPFRPVPCLLNPLCRELVPHHNFILHLQTHYLSPNYPNSSARSLLSSVAIHQSSFDLDDTWTPKWISDFNSHFFLMLSHQKGQKQKPDSGHFLCWVWMLGGEEEASKFGCEVDIFKGKRKVSGIFGVESVRKDKEQILKEKNGLKFGDKVAKHILGIETSVYSDLYIDLCIFKKPVLKEMKDV